MARLVLLITRSPTRIYAHLQ